MKRLILFIVVITASSLITEQVSGDMKADRWSGLQTKASNNEGLSLNYILTINRIKSRDSFKILSSSFRESNSLWPILLPDELSSDDEYTTPATYSVIGFTNDGISYGNLSYGSTLAKNNITSLLVVEKERLGKCADLQSFLIDFYSGHPWLNDTSCYKTRTSTVVRISFQSKADSEGQAWGVWLSWVYDDNGRCIRFDIIAWRTDAFEIDNYNPLKDPNRYGATAYYEMVFLQPSNVNNGYIFIMIFFGGLLGIMTAPFVVGYQFYSVYKISKHKIHLKVDVTALDSFDTLYHDSINFKVLALFSITIIVIIISTIVFSSDTSRVIIYHLNAGIFVYGLGLCMITLIERYNGNKVEYLRLFTVVILMVGYGLIFGLIPTANSESLLIDPEYVDSPLFIEIIYYSNVLTMSLPLFLIYSALYRTEWRFNHTTKVLYIARTSPFSKMMNVVPFDCVKSITLDSSNLKNDMVRPINSVRIVFNLCDRSVTYKFDLNDKRALNAFFSISSFLKQLGFITEHDIKNALFAKRKMGKNVFDGLGSLQQKFDMLNEELTGIDLNTLETKLLNDYNVSIEKDKGGNELILILGRFRQISFRSWMLNIAVLVSVTIVLISLSLSIAKRMYYYMGSESLQLVVPLAITITIAMMTSGILIKQINYFRYMIKNPIVTVKLLPEIFEVIIDNNKVYVPIYLIYSIERKRNHLFGSKITLKLRARYIDLFILDSNRLAKLLTQYMRCYVLTPPQKS